MKMVAEFKVSGVKPVPWKSPQVFMKTTKDGRRYKSAYRDKNLEAWQDRVKEIAGAAGAATPPVCLGPLWARLDFTVKQKDRKLHGIVCSPPVVWNDAKECWVKKGSSVADLDNLCKSVLDAVQGVVFGNDVQVVTLVATRRYGPDDSVSVKLWEIGKEDPTFRE